VVVSRPILTWPPGAGTQQLNSLNDVYVYSPANGTWAALAPIGSGPSPRYAVSMVAAPDGALYVLGGVTDAGHRVESAGVKI
jgi:N-acetylneuraminic acid mutarotase